MQINHEDFNLPIEKEKALKELDNIESEIRTIRKILSLPNFQGGQAETELRNEVDDFLTSSNVVREFYNGVVGHDVF